MHYFDVIFEISSTWFTFLMAQDLFPRCSLCLEFSPSLRYILESSYLKFKSQCDKERSPDPRCSPICLPQDNPFTPQRTTVYKAFFWGGETGGTRQTKLLSLQGMRYGGDKKHEGKHAVQAGSPRRTSTDRLRECEVPGRERPR